EPAVPRRAAQTRAGHHRLRRRDERRPPLPCIGRNRSPLPRWGEGQGEGNCMFLKLLDELRARKVPVGTHEAIALAGALEAGLHDSSLDGFYFVARSLLVHSETHLDAFDLAFAKVFKGAE